MEYVDSNFNENVGTGNVRFRITKEDLEKGNKVRVDINNTVFTANFELFEDRRSKDNTGLRITLDDDLMFKDPAGEICLKLTENATEDIMGLILNITSMIKENKYH